MKRKQEDSYSEKQSLSNKRFKESSTTAYYFSEWVNDLKQLKGKSDRFKRLPAEDLRALQSIFKYCQDWQAHNWRNECYNWVERQPRGWQARGIGYILYNLGQLAKKEKSLPPIPTDWIVFLLMTLYDCQRSRKSKDISIGLNGVGQLALAKKISEPLNVQVIKDILAALLQQRDLYAQSLAISLNALGYLAQHEDLTGTISSQEYESWMQKLLGLSDLKPQNLSNSLNALGYLAKAKRLAGKISSQDYQGWLIKLLDFSQAPALPAQKNDLQANERENKHDKEEGDTSQKLISQALSNSLNALGYLAKGRYLTGKISSDDYQGWMKELLLLPELSSQDIANSLNALGYLAQGGYLTGKISSRDCQRWIIKLLVFHPGIDPQELSNSLNALGYLAHSRDLTGKISSDDYQGWIIKLLDLPDLNSQHIANSLNALGYLAQGGYLTGKISSRDYQSWIIKLLRLPGLSPQHIANSLNALGYLAQGGYLTGAISSRDYQDWIIKLLDLPDINPQALSNSLNALGYLAQGRDLTGVISSRDYQDWIIKLLDLPDINPQELANSLNALGYLGQGEYLIGTISSRDYQDWIIKLLDLPDINPQELANSLNALGYLAQAKSLVDTVNSQDYQRWMKKLLDLPNLDAQAVSNSLNALRYLVQAKYLTGKISIEDYQEWIIKILSLPGITSQALANSLVGLGGLAKMEKLQGTIDIDVIERLLQLILEKGHMLGEHVSQCVVGVCYLQEHHHLRTPVSSVLWVQLLSCPIERSPLQRLKIALRLPTLFADNLQLGFNFFIDFTEQSYLHFLHPSPAINLLMVLLDYQTKLTEHYELSRLAKLFHWVVSNLEPYSPLIRTNLQEKISAYAVPSDWARVLTEKLQLTFPREVREGSIDAAMAAPDFSFDETEESPAEQLGQHQIRLRRQSNARLLNQTQIITKWEENSRRTTPLFQLLDRRDETGLKELLGLPETLTCQPRKPTSSSSNRSTGNTLTSRAHTSTTVNSGPFALLNDLLNNTPVERLERLFRRTTWQALRWVFRALSWHQIYQVTKTTSAYPIWLYLPLNELKGLMELLISPFMIYKDKSALLQLIDALTLRLSCSTHASERLEVQKLQVKLLERAIEFHEKRHHQHVVPALNQILTLVNRQALPLLTQAELEQAEEQNNNASIHEVTPDVPLSPPVSTNSRYRLFQPQTTVSASVEAVSSTPITASYNQAVYQEAPLPYLDYQYDSDDIKVLLTCRISELRYKEDIFCLEPASLETGPGKLTLAEELEEWKTSVWPQLNGRSKTTIVPINIDNSHWIGLFVKWQAGNIVQLILFDSLNNVSQHRKYAHHLKISLQQANLIGPEVSIEFAADLAKEPLLIQRSGVGCGPYLIENMYVLLKNAYWPQGTTEKKIRSRHLDVLKEKDPNFYQTFIDKQRQAWVDDSTKPNLISAP